MKKKTIFASIISICLIFTLFAPNFVSASDFMTKNETLNTLDMSDEMSSSIENYENINKTVNGLENYKNSVEEKTIIFTENDVKKVHATITFKEAISENELKNFLSQHNITLVQTQARLIKDDERNTISVKTEDVNKTIETVNQVASDVGGEFKGYIDLYVYLDSDKIEETQGDSRVYLVDTSADALLKGNLEENGLLRNAEYFKESTGAFPHALSWDLEELNL